MARESDIEEGQLEHMASEVKAGPNLKGMRQALRKAGIDGWLFYDFRRSNAVAHRILGIPAERFFSRRWFYYVPAQGEPTALVSAVEAHVLNDLPGQKVVFATWQEMREALGTMLAGAKRVAMEYAPAGSVPYVSMVDAGTVDLVRGLGAEVVSSADFAQAFEAVLTPAQIESHREAGRRLIQVGSDLLDWLRAQVRGTETVNEYQVQQALLARMAQAGLVDAGTDIGVNGNAANPHYAATASASSPVREGDVLLMDFWARLDEPKSVFADYTWMMFIGETVPERVATPFATLARSRDAGIALLKQRFAAGEVVRGYEVDDAVRNVLTEAGYGPAFVHRTGHNISVALHGNGAHLDNLETHDTRPLLPNTCTSVEPGIYRAQEGLGLRTEVDALLLPGEVQVTGWAQDALYPLLSDKPLPRDFLL